MRNRWGLKGLCLVILLGFPLLSASGNAAEFRGKRTRLQVNSVRTAFLPRHGQPSHRTTLILRSEPEGGALLSREIEGDWSCIGFHHKTRTYVIGGVFERGALVPMGSIQYLREDGELLEPSAFDRLGYLAMTVVAGPGGRYIAFVGGRGTTDALYVLDIERDRIRKLAPAPSPPPSLLARSACKREPFAWGGCWADGYVEMDPGIIHFRSEDVLAVSYGKDRPDARAGKRRLRLFRLGQP